MSKKGLWIVIIFIVLVLASFLAGGQTADDWEKRLKTSPDDRELLLKLGRFYHDQAGLEDRADAVEKAEKHLSRLLSLAPDNADALAYMGSVLTIKARASAPSMESLEYLNQGFSMLDRAVLLSPENLEIRLVRGVNSVHVPAEFGRGDLALEDFRAIEKLLAGASRPPDPRFLLTYNFYYGTLLAGRGEMAAAEPWLKKVIELGPDSPLAAQARKTLEGRRRP